jgi:hypothetical protein
MLTISVKYPVLGLHPTHVTTPHISVIVCIPAKVYLETWLLQ